MPLDLDFYMYKYGPFSSDLRQLLGEMRTSYLIEVEPREPYGPSLVVSDSGRELLKRFPRTRSRYTAKIDFVATRLGARSVAELERLSTVLFVRREGTGATETDQVTRVVELKPHVDVLQAEEAIIEVDALLAEAAEKGLVSTEAAVS